MKHYNSPKDWDTLRKEYYEWLCNLSGHTYAGSTYSNLMRCLYEKSFHEKVPGDGNRAFEAFEFRKRFCEDMNYNFNSYKYIISNVNDQGWLGFNMLEVILVLAQGCERVLRGMPGEQPMDYWFWYLLTNVGLDKFDDDNWVGGDSEIHDDSQWVGNDEMEVDAILDTIVNRQYDKNGVGGFFPLSGMTEVDQRKTELWYQLSEYMIKKYLKRSLKEDRVIVSS